VQHDMQEDSPDEQVSLETDDSEYVELQVMEVLLWGEQDSPE